MQVGQRVAGVYCGDFPFSGEIEDMRMLTVRTDGCFEFHVKLDAPLTVYGEPRDTIVMYTKFDGSQSSYTRGVRTFMQPI